MQLTLGHAVQHHVNKYICASPASAITVGVTEIRRKLSMHMLFSAVLYLSLLSKHILVVLYVFFNILVFQKNENFFLYLQ